MESLIHLICVQTLLTQFVCVHTIRLTALEVPPVAISGTPVWLNCSYDLERDRLYSIKWFRNDQEFYRFLPIDIPPVHIFATTGVYVNTLKSNYGSVYLNRVDLKTDGLFRCEVSAEAPSFQTVRKEAEMRVYYLPKEDPIIEGTRAEYQIGDVVNVSCLAGPAKPPAKLIWYINDVEAPKHFVKEFSSSKQHQHQYQNQHQHQPVRSRQPSTGLDGGLEMSTLGLVFTTERHHFVNGMIKLRCTALIAQVFSRHQEVIARDEEKESGIHKVDEGDGPIIEGGKSSYAVGDFVNVTCTSRRSNPGAELKWYINDNEADPNFLHFHHQSFGDKTEINSLRLEFPVTAMDYLPQNQMRLKCAATLFKVINSQSQETTINGHSESLRNFGQCFKPLTILVGLLLMVSVG